MNTNSPTTPSDAPTPETDGEVYEVCEGQHFSYTKHVVVSADHARRLERERNKWKESCFKADEICLEVMRERDEARAELVRTNEAYVEILRRYTRGQAELAQLKSDLALIDAIEKEARLTEGSAVEWVKTKLFPVRDDDGRTHFDLSDYHSFELARRADEAEQECRDQWKASEISTRIIDDLRAQLAAAQDTLELYKAANSDVARIAAERDAAQAEARELREALEWLEDEVPQITHDSWTCSVDMAGNRWTLQFRNDGKRERIRGRTLIDAISKAIAALAKKEGER